MIAAAPDNETQIRAAHEAVKQAIEQEKKAEQEESRAIGHADNCRRVAQQRRLEVGRLLLVARSQYPQRGPNAKGWGEFLRRVGIHEQSAREWMQLAEATDISKPEDGGLEITRQQARAIVGGDSEAPAPAQPKRAEVLRLDRQLCGYRLRASLIRMLEAGAVNAELLCAALDVPDEVRVFGVKPNEARWHDFQPEDRNAVIVEWEVTLRAALEALEALRTSQP